MSGLFPPYHMLRKIFLRNKDPEPVPEKKPWPSALNPCPTPMTEKHHTAVLWDVGGRVTKVCNGCVAEAEKRLGDRTKALATFNSDPNGNPCIYE